MPAASSPTRTTSRRAILTPKPPTLVQSQQPDTQTEPVRDVAHATIPARKADEPSTQPSIPTEPTELSLIGALFSETLALEDLARAHGLSLRSLIAWAERRDIAALRRSMRELADDRADMIVSRARTAAAHRLQTLSAVAVNEETSRKACVDLLRLRSAPGIPSPDPLPTPTPSDADSLEASNDSDDDLLAHLDRLARVTHAPRLANIDDRDLDAPPSGAD